MKAKAEVAQLEKKIKVEVVVNQVVKVKVVVGVIILIMKKI